jgi:diaminopimelate decarboxylase
MNVESESELMRIERLAAMKKTQAAFSLRVNPDVDAKTHPYISTGMWEHKFGLPFDQAFELYVKTQKSSSLKALGISLHIGSQIFDMAVLKEAVEKSIALAKELREAGVELEILDVGGGLGVDYSKSDSLPDFEGYARFLHEAAQKWSELTGKKGRLIFECGRAFTAQAGFLVTEVIALKKSLKKNFLIVDASMTELLRPALYKAEHPVWSLKAKAGHSEKGLKWEVVGPVCESSDVLAKNIGLESVGEGDFLALGCSGAYGAVMSQTYNSRPLPQEWWQDREGNWTLLRKNQERRY